MPKITFILLDDHETTVDAAVGDNLLDVCRAQDIPMVGSCEGSLACSTCHVSIENQAIFDSLDEPQEEEEDMLDLAKGVTPLSRLGCQVIVTEAMDGLRIRIMPT